MTQGEVGASLAAALSGAVDLELGTAGVETFGVPALEGVAPGFDEEALGEGGFGGGFLEDFAGGPGAEALVQGFGFRGGGEVLLFGVPVGGEESVVQKREEGHGPVMRNPVEKPSPQAGQNRFSGQMHGMPL
ncbi:MAG: hypothetical protein JJU05_13535 [Verrucomicrobia bacterium]|nr:hypothetical protein [Verrucomicrobiota bacterium]MCH8527458.1 hypothetical protein [Kiritimatiellia bacterium]